MAFSETWIVFALMAAAAWGLSCVIDACFVGEGVYKRPIDGPVVAGLFFLVPLVTGESGESGDHAVAANPAPLLVAFLAGLMMLVHIYFYFRALFEVNDASNAEIFNTLSVLIVPLLAFVVLDDRLQPAHYLAVGLAGCAILALLRSDLSSLTLRVTTQLGASVFAISVVIVMQAWVLQSLDYETAIWWFSLGAFSGTVVLLLINGSLRKRVARIFRRYAALVTGVQLLELIAILGSQRATDLGPSVSLVVLVECSLPVFIMLFSWLFLGSLRYWLQAGHRNLQTVLIAQTQAYPAKLLSLAVIVMAIGLAQSVV